VDQKDIKNLISGFLILAVLAGSATLIVSNFLRSPSPSVKTNNAPYAETAAFPSVPRSTALPAGVAPLDLTPEAVAQLPPLDSNNLTDQFAKHIADAIIKENERRPGQEQAAREGLAVPENLDDVAASYIAQQVLELPPLPPVDETRLRVHNNPTLDDIDVYTKNAASVIEQAFGEEGLGRLVGRYAKEPPSAEVLAAVNSLYSHTIDSLYQMEVPASVTEVHVALIQGLEAQRVAFDSTYKTDPLKAIATIDNFDAIVDRGERNFTDAWEQAQGKLSLQAVKEYSQTHSPVQRAMRTFLGVPQAFAFLGEDATSKWRTFKATVTAIFTGKTSVSTTGSFLHDLMKWGRLLARDILANNLIHRLVQQTISWIQGGGKPRFVVNWRNLLDQTLNQSAMAALQGASKAFCPSYAPLLVQQISTSYNSPPFVPAANCLLEDLVGDINGFYDNFALGGWTAYALSVVPPGNYFATTLETQLVVSRESKRTQQAKQAQLNTGKGFLPTQQCVKSTEQEETVLGEIGSDAVEQFKAARSKEPGVLSVSCQGSAGDIVTTCVVRTCTPDGYAVTTPGSAVAAQLDKALGSSIDYIVNAQDIIALVNALVQSGLNKLFRAGDRGISGLARAGAGETVGGGGGGGGARTDPCAGLTGDQLRDCRDSTGGEDGGEDLASQKADLLKQVNGILADLKKIEDDDREWNAVASSSIPVLQILADGCTNTVGQDAKRAITAINQIRDAVNKELAEIADAKRKFEDVKAKIEAATRLDQLSEYTSVLADASTYSNQSGEAEQRLFYINDVKRSAEEKERERFLGALLCKEVPPLSQPD
jgi:hypothetical protein